MTIHEIFLIEKNIDRIERITNRRQSFWDVVAGLDQSVQKGHHNILKTIRRGEYYRDASALTKVIKRINMCCSYY